MKKIYLLFIATFIGFQMKSQLTLTQAANEPVLGNTQNTRELDSLTAVPKNTGTGQLWNFNTSMTQKTYTETTTYTTVASVSGGTAFPAANIAAARGGTGADFYKTSLNKLELAGFIDGNSGNKIVFNTPATWYPWPISYGAIFSGSFTAVETGTSTNANWVGNVSYTACGTGTVVLPGGNVHNNCLMYRRYININMSGSYTAQLNLVQYDFFSSSNKFPIMHFEYQSVTSGTNISKSAWFYADMNAMSVGVNEINIPATQFILFPNPASDVVNVVLPSNELPSKIELLDVTGKMVLSGYNASQISVKGIQNGLYYILVYGKDAIIRKPIVIGN